MLILFGRCVLEFGPSCDGLWHPCSRSVVFHQVRSVLQLQVVRDFVLLPFSKTMLQAASYCRLVHLSLIQGNYLVAGVLWFPGFVLTFCLSQLRCFCFENHKPNLRFLRGTTSWIKNVCPVVYQVVYRHYNWTFNDSNNSRQIEEILIPVQSPAAAHTWSRWSAARTSLEEAGLQETGAPQGFDPLTRHSSSWLFAQTTESESQNRGILSCGF